MGIYPPLRSGCIKPIILQAGGKISNYISGFCGGNFTEANGHISSPSYPQRYSANEDCVYTISGTTGTFLLLTVLEFELYGGWKRCDDYLEIRDGSSEDSPLIGKFCKDMPTFIQSTQSKVWIR